MGQGLDLVRPHMLYCIASYLEILNQCTLKAHQMPNYAGRMYPRSLPRDPLVTWGASPLLLASTSLHGFSESVPDSNHTCQFSFQSHHSWSCILPSFLGVGLPPVQIHPFIQISSLLQLVLWAAELKGGREADSPWTLQFVFPPEKNTLHDKISLDFARLRLGLVDDVCLYCVWEPSLFS